ncbi:MAG: polysaccharide biosynthesis protein [Mogibacterium sp.]|nr:polysaccharide biosynthesis protein [Mogibacterium sp.]
MNPKKTSFASNVLMMMAAQFLIKILGLVYRLVILNIEGFGDVGNGYYSAGYQVYAVLLILSSQGIPGAISKLVSDRVALGEYRKAHRVFKVALILVGLIGLAVSLLLLVFSDFIASSILHVPEVTYVLKVLSPAIFFVCVSAVIRGYFAGLGTMKATSISQPLEQFFNCVLTIAFVYALVGRDPYIMAAGGNVSTTLAVMISFSYLLIFYKRNIGKYSEDHSEEAPEERESSLRLAKLVLLTAIPLTIGSLISVITAFIDTITVSNCIQIAFRDILHDKELLEIEAMRATGILSKVDTLVNLPLAINLAFYSVLIPELTGLITVGDREGASRKISSSLSVSSLIILPCAVGFIVLADPILRMLYPNAPDGALVLQISAFTMIFVALGHTLQGALFGLGRMYTPAVALTVGSVIKVFLNLILISNPKIGMYGAVISSLICQLITFTIIVVVLRRTIPFRVDKVKTILAPAGASLLMGLIIIGVQLLLQEKLGNTILTLLCILIGVVVYGMTVALLRVFTREEICALPMGGRLYALLTRLRIYQEEEA